MNFILLYDNNSDNGRISRTSDKKKMRIKKRMRLRFHIYICPANMGPSDAECGIGQTHRMRAAFKTTYNMATENLCSESI